MSFASGLYGGVVSHRRFAPKVHALRYAIFQLLLDLDEADSLDRGLRHFARNRAALISFHDRDHGDGRADLKSYVMDVCAQAGIPDDGGKVLCLSMPRVLGQAFNPLTIYWRHDASGALRAMLYEVNNTFGERHSYLIPVAEDGPVLRQSCAKDFFVSPFMDLAMIYDFKLTRPGDFLSTTVNGADLSGRPLITATFSGKRQDLTDAALVRTFWRHPLLMLKVLGAIHLEAFKLVLKGITLKPKPAPPAAVTVSEAHPPVGREAIDRVGVAPVPALQGRLQGDAQHPEAA